MKNDFNLEAKKISFLGMKESIRDIKEMNKYFKIFLLIGAVIIIFFNFFSFSTVHGTHFVPVQQYWSAFDNPKGNIFGDVHDHSSSLAIAILYSLSGTASITGLLAVSMIVEGKTSQFFWGMINSAFYAAFALSAGYIGDFWMNIILVLGGPLGWYLFSYKEKAGLDLEEGHNWKFKLTFWFGIIIAIVLMITLWFFLIPGAYETMFGINYKDVSGTSDTMHWFDAIVNGSNSVGYTLQLVNFSQQFYVWFFVDFFRMMKFTGAAPGTLEPTMIIQFAIWFTTDAIGIYKRVIKPKLIAKKQNK